MNQQGNILSQFWQELKRRKVVRVITVYAAVSFVILELASIIQEPFGLPDWTIKLVFVILCIGLIISIILSWIYDITPEGIEKTKPAQEIQKGEKTITPNSWKIATYISIGIIIALLGLQIFNNGAKSRGISYEWKSIAILPFVNISGNPDQEYFVNGITETLIIELSRISALKVITIRNADMAFTVHDQEKQIDAVLEGTAFLVGDSVRVTAKLIDLSTAEILLANSYDHELHDVFKLHSDVVNKIANEINVFLTEEEEKHLARPMKIDPEVYKLYLKGRYHIGKRTEEGLLNAIHYFEEAVKSDPQSAYAHSGMADAYTLLCEYGLISAEEAYPKAKAAADKAIKIDDGIAETHSSLAYVKLIFEWDWIEAEKSFKKAIELNSNYATAHHWYSYYLSLQNRIEESISEQLLALELDPLSGIINKGLGHRYLNARQYEKVIEAQLQTLEIEPKFAPAYHEMGFAYTQLGKYEEAIEAFQAAKDISGGLVGLTGPTRGYGYAKAGMRKEALEILDQYSELAKERYVNPYSFAVIYIGLGEWEKSLEWLDKSYKLRSPSLIRLKANPIWDPIRSDTRFIEIYNKIWSE